MDFWIFHAKVIAPIVSAIGIVIVSVLAIWGERFKIKPRLVLEPHNLEGSDTVVVKHNPFDGSVSIRRDAVYYHLKVVNKNRILAKNVRVICTGIYKKSIENIEHERVKTYVDQQFTWSPAETSPMTQNILKYRILDLGRVVDNRQFELTFYVRPNNFQGFIKSGESIRVDIEIVGDNFAHNKSYTYEIYLDPTKGEMLNKQITITPL